MAKVEINAFNQNRWRIFVETGHECCVPVSIDIDDLDIETRKAMIKALVDSVL